MWDNTTASRKRHKYTDSSVTVHLPEETGVQLLCAASYDIPCRDLDTDQTSTEQTCGGTDQNGKMYAQHHIQR